MEGSTKFIIGIVVIVLVGLPLAGQLAKRPAATAPSPTLKSATEAPAEQPPPSYAPEQYQQPVAQPQPGAPPPAPRKPQPPPPPMNLANTAWTISHPQYGEVTVELFGNGQAIAQGGQIPIPIQGTWVQRGNSLTVSAMGQTISAQLQGDQLVANGMAARRRR